MELAKEGAVGLVQMEGDERAGEWERVAGFEFLDAERTRSLHRVVRYEGFFEGGVFADYGLYEFKVT